MNTSKSTLYSFLFIFLLLLQGSDCKDSKTRYIPASINTSNDNWESRFYMAGGVDSTVHATAVDFNGRMVIGGSFTLPTAGSGNSSPNSFLNNIAWWDGAQWRPLGSGVFGVVYALLFDTQGRLYVGGSFTRAGNTSARNIARYDFATGKWEDLGSVNSTVYTLTMDGQSRLYMGGDFTQVNLTGTTVNANRLAIYDSQSNSWTAIGGGVNGTVRALALDSQSNLYAGGSFTNAGGVASADYIAKIANPTGSPSFSSLGTGLNAAVYSIYAEGSQVYIGGLFSRDQSTPATILNRIAIWNGSTWTNVGGGVSSTIGNVHVLTKDTQGRLFVGGDFSQVGNMTGTAGIAYWNGATWNSLGNGGLRTRVRALTTTPNGSLLIGGDLFSTAAGTIFCNNVILWRSNPGWQTFGSSSSQAISPTVYTSVVTPDNKILFTGNFVGAGPIQTNGGILYDPTTGQWSRPWMGGPDDYDNVFATAVASNGNIYIGGDWVDFFDVNGNEFSHGGVERYFAIWRASTRRWESPGDVDDAVRAIALDEARGNLFMGGDFFSVSNQGQIAVSGSRYIVRLDIHQMWWYPMGQGTNGAVYALAVNNQGQVYVGGAFTLAAQTSGDLVNTRSIAKYDPTTGLWSALGQVSGTVFAIAVDGRYVYIGGRFTSVDGVPCNNIARWDGQVWDSLQGGVGRGGVDTVYALSVVNGTLFVGGSFPASGTASANIAFWRNGFWYPMGGGTDNTVFTMVPHNGRLWIGGNFSRTGNKTNGGAGSWIMR